MRPRTRVRFARLAFPIRLPSKHGVAGFDLSAYLGRIGWQGPLDATLPTLTGLMRAHMRAIPFENLDVLLGRGVRLDLDSVFAKLVTARRGGYCFEHSSLFAAALEHAGFAPAAHSARVVMVAARSAAPRTHMFLSVPLAEGRFVVDPGFGLLAPRLPVRLEEGSKASLDRESHWMARHGGFWVMRAQTPEKAVDAWVSTLEADNAVDFEMANHYTSTHPASGFVNRLMLRALTSDGSVAVMNREVTFRDSGVARANQLADRASLRRLLVDHFGFDLPEVERIRVPTIPEWD